MSLAAIAVLSHVHVTWTHPRRERALTFEQYTALSADDLAGSRAVWVSPAKYLEILRRTAKAAS